MAGSCGTCPFLGIRDMGTGWGELPWHKCRGEGYVHCHCSPLLRTRPGLSELPNPAWPGHLNPAGPGAGKAKGFAQCQEGGSPAPEPHGRALGAWDAALLRGRGRAWGLPRDPKGAVDGDVDRGGW